MVLSLINHHQNKEGNMKSFKINNIVDNGLVAALYVTISLITYPLSFGMVQFRVAEILMLLCFFRNDFAIGLVFGCVITNIASFSPLDILFGSLATLLSCLVIMFSKHLFLAMLAPIVFNAFIIGLELHYLLGEPMWMAIGFVALGEAVVMVVGYIIFMFLKRNKNFMSIIKANQNLDFKI